MNKRMAAVVLIVDIIFYAAGLAADGNGSTSGNYVHTTSAAWSLAQIVPILPSGGKFSCCYR